MNERLVNYLNLVQRVDTLCQQIGEALHGQITCTEGCSGCCTGITIFPVEAAALQAYLESLPAEEVSTIRRLASEHGESNGCPLLSRQRCLVYPARPLICRTHGLPIMFSDGGDRKVDCCPLNLPDCTSLPGSSVIDLDRLNELLVAVNALYRSQVAGGADLPERLTLLEAVLGQTKDD